MTARHAVDVDNLRACVDELIGTDRLLARVAGLLHAERTPGPAEVGKGKGGKKPVAPTPWNDEAAGVLFTVHAGARETEGDLTWLVFSRKLHRSGSDVHTRRALRQIPDLVQVASERFPEHWTVDVRNPRSAPRVLASWPRQCRLLLDEARRFEEPWTNAPGSLRCPHCGRRLVLAPGWDREPEPPVWCRQCPVRLDDDDPARVDRSWPATAWLATLNAETVGG